MLVDNNRDSMKELAVDFAKLLIQHDRAVLRYILTFVPSRTDAEEVLQRTAVVLWEKFAEYQPGTEFLRWALKVAYYEILNYRKEYARSRLVFSEAVLSTLADERDEDATEYEFQQAALRICLGKLVPDELMLLQRRYCDGASIVDLAAVTGKTAKSLYRRLDRIREMLAICMERRLSGACS